MWKDIEKLKEVLGTQFPQNNWTNKDWRDLFSMLKRLNSISMDYDHEYKKAAVVITALATAKPFTFPKLE